MILYFLADVPLKPVVFSMSVTLGNCESVTESFKKSGDHEGQSELSLKSVLEQLMCARSVLKGTQTKPRTREHWFWFGFLLSMMMSCSPLC